VRAGPVEGKEWKGRLRHIEVRSFGEKNLLPKERVPPLKVEGKPNVYLVVGRGVFPPPRGGEGSMKRG